MCLKMRSFQIIALFVICMMLTSIEGKKPKREEPSSQSDEYIDYYDNVEPCQCGVFLTQQVTVKSGRRSRPRGPPTGEPVVTYETEEPALPCGFNGDKNCISKCLDVILKYLPKAGPVICGAVDRDVDRERAFLFIKNCGTVWTPTNFSAGKEFCCTDGQHHQC